MAAVQSIFERYTSSSPLHSHRLRDTRVLSSQLTDSTDQSLLKLPPRPGPHGPGLRQRHHGQGRDPRRLDRTPSPTSPVLVGAGPAGRRRRLVVHEQAAHRARERQLQRRHARGRRGGHLRHAHHHRAGADCQARVLDVSSSFLLFSVCSLFRADGDCARFLGGVTRTLNISYLKAVPISKFLQRRKSKELGQEVLPA